MSAFFTPQCNKMPWRQGRWSPSCRCQHTPSVPPTLVKRQTDPFHPGPATARRPQAGSRRLGPLETAAPRAPVPPRALSSLLCLPRAHHLLRVHSCTHVCSPSPLNAHSFLVSLSVLQSGPLGLAVVPCSQPTPEVTVTALQGPRATLTSPLSTQPPSTLPSGSHRPLLVTGVCQCRCSAWQREDTKSTSVQMNDYFPNESPALSISGLLSGRPVRLFYLWDVVHVNISM